MKKLNLYLYKITQLGSDRITLGMGILSQFDFPYIVVPFDDVCFLITEMSELPIKISFKRDTQKPEIVFVSPLGTKKEVTLSGIVSNIEHYFYANSTFLDRIGQVFGKKKDNFVQIIVQNIVNSFKYEIDSERQ